MSNERSLRHYLTNKAQAMDEGAQTFGSGDDVRETVSAECTASDLTGIRRIRIRDFQLISDSGPLFGGFSLGPSSPEMLLGVLASCLTHTYLIGAAQRKISLDKIQVRFEAENNDAAFLGLTTNDPSYPHNIRAFVQVESDASLQDMQDLHDYASRTCPLTKLIRQAVPLDISVAS